MKRTLVKRCLLAGALLLAPSAATGLASASAEQFAGPIRGSLTGTITALDGSTFTIQTAGKRTGLVNALTRTANRISEHGYPYVWGGGHAQAGIASTGGEGDRTTPGYDCSGSVAAVLAGAGLWPAGSGVPSDSGIIAQLRQEGLIAPGAGIGPVEVTLYDDPGFHIFMSIDGRFFGTSDGGDADPNGEPIWLDDGAPDASDSSYKRYHFLPNVLRAATDAGHIDSFELGQLGEPVLQLDQTLQVSYKETAAGQMIATALTYPGALTASGTLESLGQDGASFAIQTEAGTALTFATDGFPQMLDGYTSGESVQVSYGQHDSTLTAHSLTLTSEPPPSPPPTSTEPSSTVTGPTSASPTGAGGQGEWEAGPEAQGGGHWGGPGLSPGGYGR